MTWPLLLLACGAPAETTVLEGFTFEWDLFNHRTSHLAAAVDGDVARVAVIGGTSTTGVPAELADGCDPDTCQEFPFLDEARVDLRWATVRSRRLAVAAPVEVALEAGPEPTSATFEVVFDERVRGDVIAVLSGVVIDSDVPIDDSCYDPAFGWLPRRVAIGLSDAALADDGRSATVTATAAFEAGVTLEDERACLDAVVDRARIAVTLRVTALAGGEARRQDVAHGMVYSYGDGPGTPDAQPDPDPADRPLTIAGDVYGWSALDWSFHGDDADGRGAYLRRLSFVADAEAGVASGHATNYSPGTQLSGFDYTFAGTVRAIDVGGEVTRGAVTDTLPAELDDAGEPVTHELPL